MNLNKSMLLNQNLEYFKENCRGKAASYNVLIKDYVI